MNKSEGIKHLPTEVWEVKISHIIEHNSEIVSSVLFNSFSEAARFKGLINKEIFPPEGMKFSMKLVSNGDKNLVDYELNGKHHIYTVEIKKIGVLYNSISDISDLDDFKHTVLNFGK